MPFGSLADFPSAVSDKAFCPPLCTGSYPPASSMSELADTFPEDHSVFPNILFLCSSTQAFFWKLPYK